MIRAAATRRGPMDRRPRARPGRRWLLPGLLAALAVGAAARAEPLDLRGTWFVVVHYKDEATANPEAERWEDKVWTFEERGELLRWSEYRIVVFQDATGRFEPIPGNPRSRVLGYWWPNEQQRAEIEGGPRVNQRGSRSKDLKGSDAEGWTSRDRLRVRSATAIGFQEQVRIDDLDGLPVFVREDRVGTASKLRSEGRTEYRTEEVLGGGRELRGSYRKDGHRAGRFRMFRTREPRGLRSSEEEGTVNERFQRRWLEEALDEQREGRAGGEDSP